MNRRKVDKKYRSIRNKVFLVLLFLLLLLLALAYIHQQSKIINSLVERNNMQYTQMKELSKKVKVLQIRNERLENAVIYEHEKLQSINTHKQVKPVMVEENTVTDNDDINLLSPPDFTTVIIGTLATFGSVLRVLVPAI